MEKDTKQLFQITEAARACGLSRSTLMRIEEKGLLTPAYTAPDSGRRYYDNHNVARILQIEKFKAMGLDTEDIAAYFAHGGEASGMLTVLERRLLDLQRSVEELRLRALEPPCTSVQMMTLPAVTCCMRWSVGLTTADRYADMYSFYGECVRRGYRLSDEPLFTISQRQDYLEGYIGDTPFPYAVCVPVRPKKAPEDAVTLPACRALSVLYCGDYAGVNEAWLTLGREARARGLKPPGCRAYWALWRPTRAGRSTRSGTAPASSSRWRGKKRRGNEMGDTRTKQQTGMAGLLLCRCAVSCRRTG